MEAAHNVVTTCRGDNICISKVQSGAIKMCMVLSKCVMTAAYMTSNIKFGMWLSDNALPRLMHPSSLILCEAFINQCICISK